MGERGQASVELVASIPILVAVALGCFHLLAAGHALGLADGAAEAAAIALASGGEPETAAREALPGWARDRIELETVGGRVTVRLRPRSPLAALTRGLEVSSTAWVLRPGARR